VAQWRDVVAQLRYVVAQWQRVLLVDVQAKFEMWRLNVGAPGRGPVVLGTNLASPQPTADC
jgi:hypothetical protein